MLPPFQASGFIPISFYLTADFLKPAGSSVPFTAFTQDYFMLDISFSGGGVREAYWWGGKGMGIPFLSRQETEYQIFSRRFENG